MHKPKELAFGNLAENVYEHPTPNQSNILYITHSLFPRTLILPSQNNVDIKI